MFVFFLVVEYKVADMGYLRFYLAPKMEDADWSISNDRDLIGYGGTKFKTSFQIWHEIFMLYDFAGQVRKTLQLYKWGPTLEIVENFTCNHFLPMNINKHSLWPYMMFMITGFLTDCFVKADVWQFRIVNAILLKFPRTDQILFWAVVGTLEQTWIII